MLGDLYPLLGFIMRSNAVPNNYPKKGPYNIVSLLYLIDNNRILCCQE